MNDILGNPPELKYLDIDDLTIDVSYQRGTQSRMSEKNIHRIASKFSWQKFGVIIVAKKEGGKKYSVIDGQHRVIACINRGDIDKIPCCIIDAYQIIDQAKSFVSINKDRVALHTVSQFHADVAAGDKLCVNVQKMLDEINITVPKHPVQGGATAPRVCQATGAMKTLYKKFGANNLKSALLAIAESYPKTKGQMRPMFIQALAEIYSYGGVNQARMVDIIKKTDPEHLQETARNYTKFEPGSVLSAMIKGFLREYNKGIPKIEKIVAK